MQSLRNWRICYQRLIVIKTREIGRRLSTLQLVPSVWIKKAFFFFFIALFVTYSPGNVVKCWFCTKPEFITIPYLHLHKWHMVIEYRLLWTFSYADIWAHPLCWCQMFPVSPTLCFSLNYAREGSDEWAGPVAGRLVFFNVKNWTTYKWWHWI